MSLYVNIPDAGSAGGSSVTSPLSGDGSGGNPIVIAAASAATAGTMSIADFNKLATVPAGSGLLSKIYKSGPVDFLSTGAGGTAVFDMPLVPDRLLFVGSVRAIITATTGTSTGNWVFNLGTNGAVDNVGTGMGLVAASFNKSLTKPYTSSDIPTSVALVDSNVAPLSLKTTTALGGASVVTGYVEAVITHISP